MITILKIIIVFFFLNVFSLFGRTEIIILSSNVGTEIDEHENRFYRIFPKEKQLINAQLIKIGQESYRIDVVKKINGKINKVNRYINQNEFDKLKIHNPSKAYVIKVIFLLIFSISKIFINLI